jgi:predicted nucleic acid-binding protein
MGEKYLIDTNVIIDFSENKITARHKLFISSVIDADPFLSVINKIELLSFPVIRNGISELLSTATVIGLTDEIIDKTFNLRKLYRIKLPDAIIAATALVHNLSLVTNDVSGFKGIKGLKVINPVNR